jgi:hypothetical protein
MLYQLSYASPETTRKLVRKPIENVGTLPLHADYGIECKVSILKRVEQTMGARISVPFPQQLA